jgi:hypothetical protein
MSLGGLREAMQNAQKSGKFLEDIDNRIVSLEAKIDNILIKLDRILQLELK